MTSCQPLQPTSSPLSSSRFRCWAVFILGALLLAAAVWLVYGRALTAPFIFDDRVTLLSNPSIMRLWPLWSSGKGGGPLNPPPNLPTSARPVVNLTFAINYHFGQLDTTGYHAFNIVVHLLSALLLWAIVRRTLLLEYFGGRFDRAAGLLSFAAALVWAVHPLNTESVAYITQRTESLMGFFYISVLYASLNYWQARSAWLRMAWLVVASVAGILGMLSKEMMASAIGVVLLYERTFIAGSFGRALRNSWPLYIGLALGWTSFAWIYHRGARTPLAGFGLGIPALVWWLTQTKVLLMMLKLAFWPWPLVIHYEIPHLKTLGAAWHFVLPVALGIAITLVLVWRRSAAGFVALAVLAVLSPTLLIPLPPETLSERRMYVPLTAIVPLVIVGGFAWLQWLGRYFTVDPSSTKASRPVLVVWATAALALSIVLGLVSIRRLAAYQDELTIWQDAAIHQPHNPVVQINLGEVLAHRGHPQEAIPYFQEGLRLAPKHSHGHYNLASALAETGRMEEALMHYEQAVQSTPDFADAHYDYARNLLAVGRMSEAIEHFEAALRVRPDFAAAHNNLGMALVGMGRPAEAVDHIEQALALEPDAEGYVNLASACVLAQRPAAAIAAGEKGLALARAQDKQELASQIETWLSAYRRRATQP